MYYYLDTEIEFHSNCLLQVSTFPFQNSAVISVFLFWVKS